MRPKKVKIFNCIYTIKQLPQGLAEDLDGNVITETLSIYINANRPPAIQRETLLHEVIHVLVETLQLDKALEEEICTRIAMGLMTVMMDNPKLKKYLVG